MKSSTWKRAAPPKHPSDWSMASWCVCGLCNGFGSNTCCTFLLRLQSAFRGCIESAFFLSFLLDKTFCSQVWWCAVRVTQPLLTPILPDANRPILTQCLNTSVKTKCVCCNAATNVDCYSPNHCWHIHYFYEWQDNSFISIVYIFMSTSPQYKTVFMFRFIVLYAQLWI